APCLPMPEVVMLPSAMSPLCPLERTLKRTLERAGTTTREPDGFRPAADRPGRAGRKCPPNPSFAVLFAGFRLDSRPPAAISPGTRRQVFLAPIVFAWPAGIA